MYVLTHSQTLWPILALTVFIGVFVVAMVKGFMVNKEDADRWGRIPFGDEYPTEQE